MEDHFDIIPVSCRTERIGRLRDLIIEIEADYKRYKYLKQKIETGIGDNADIEELHRREAWMKRDVTAYRRLNAMSIEGVTFAGFGGFSASYCREK